GPARRPPAEARAPAAGPSSRAGPAPNGPHGRAGDLHPVVARLPDRHRGAGPGREQRAPRPLRLVALLPGFLLVPGRPPALPTPRTTLLAALKGRRQHRAAVQSAAKLAQSCPRRRNRLPHGLRLDAGLRRPADPL